MSASGTPIADMRIAFAFSIPAPIRQSRAVRPQIGFLDIQRCVADAAQPALPAFHDGLSKGSRGRLTPQQWKRAGHLPGSVQLLKGPRLQPNHLRLLKRAGLLPNALRLLERSGLLPRTLWLTDLKRPLGVGGQNAEGDGKQSEDETHGDLRSIALEGSDPSSDGARRFRCRHR